MARITIEDCTKRENNRFGLVLMTAIRAKQLMRGARSLVQAEENRPIVVALREVASGRIQKELQEGEDPDI